MKSFLGFWLLLAAITVCMAVGTSAVADTVSVRFWSNDGLVLVERDVPAGIGPVEAAVAALVAGPTQPEMALGISSRIPAGVTITSLQVTNTSVAIDMSAGVLAGLDEARLQDIFDQFRTTLGDFPYISSIKLTSGGRLLSSYLAPAPEVGPPAASGQPTTSGVGLSGKKICVGPSHGRFWNGGGWYWQRTLTCGWGEAVLEDTNSIHLVQFLSQYLTQDGATFTCPRQLNESDCCNADTGYPWWKMCAQSWLHHAGVSSSIWASSSGNSGADTAADRSGDDIRARPLYADNRAADIYIAHHTNAGGGGTANGTETFRDTAMEHPAHETNSYNLASAVQSSVVTTIRNTFPGESGWSNRGVKDSAGGFGEIRIPNRPAILIELAFHDDCARDALYLKDDFFRSLCEWAIYSGICTYFGNTPTWDKYSDEYVSDTIPTTMLAGQNYNVSVTFRNRGVSWFTSYGFRLGAVGDSDPFTTSTRFDISGQVKPGSTYTFNFTLKAPASNGTYTTDWRMVRDGYAWFGATLTKSIQVGAADTSPPTVPANLRRTGVSTSSITISWDASTDDSAVAGYRVYRNGVQVGTSTTTSYTDSSLAPNTLFTYQVDAYDGTPNYSAKSDPLTTGTAATWSRAASSADTYIRSGSTSVVSSQPATLQVGLSSTASVAVRRGLVQWDMTGAPSQNEALDAGNSVRVKLYCYLRSADTATNVYLNRVTADWTESNANWDLLGSAYDTLFATTSVGALGDYAWAWNGHSLGLPVPSRGVIARNGDEATATLSKIFNDKDDTGGTGAATRPRLEIDYVDLTPPTSGTISINSGAAYAISPAVTLTLFATDALSSVSQMRFNNEGGEWSDWEPYATSTSWELSGDDGTKTVYVQFKDAAGNVSTGTISDSIELVTFIPTSSADPAGGVYNAPQNVTLSADSTATIYYTVDGSEPGTGSNVYSGAIAVSADTPLRFFAVSPAGNTESPSHREDYTILTGNGSTAQARQASLGSPVRLGDKVLYLKSGSFGYIEDANRLGGIRIEGDITADEGQLVCLVGTRAVTAYSEPCIAVSRMTPHGPGSVAPWGTDSRTFQYNLLDGICVRTWGIVNWVSLTPRCYVLTTGGVDSEIVVIPKEAPTVSIGDRVTVTGAVGYSPGKVIYQK